MREEEAVKKDRVKNLMPLGWEITTTQINRVKFCISNSSNTVALKLTVYFLKLDVT